MDTTKIKLNVGCGRSRQDGYINCDKYPGKNVDYVFDLEQEWPFKDNTVDEIYASHVLEHLPNYMAFFNEAWRVLKPMGILFIRVPYGHTTAAMSDLTHVRPWYPISFVGLQPGFDDASNGNHYDSHKAFFWTLETVLIVQAWVARIFKWPFGRYIAMFMIRHFVDVVYEMWAVLQKSSGDRIRSKDPAFIPCEIAVWESDLKGETHETGKVSKIVRLR